MLNKRRVVVTGLGLITPLGIGVNKNWSNLKPGNLETGFVKLESKEYQNLPCKIAGRINSLDLDKKIAEINIPKSDLKSMSLANLYGLIAADEAIKDSGWSASNEDESFRAGCSIATGMAGLIEISETSLTLNESDVRAYKLMSPYFVPKILPNLTSGLISIKYKLKGPNHCVTTACAAGTHSILEASEFIKNDFADVMICGATEACIHPISIAGFSRMRALATKFNDKPQRASRPFDKDRNGFVMSEGAGCLVLESLDHALKRKAKIYAEILGGSLNADASHITNPTGQGALKCMKDAIKRSGLKLDQIDYINAHATSTPTGDLAEINAIKNLFENKALNRIFISSLKGSLGHLLGAAGAAETILTILACNLKKLPSTNNLDHIDAEIVLMPNLVLNQNEIDLSYKKHVVALKNSFGFGGTNASVCITNFIE